MKISTKIAAGYGILIALIVAALAYQTSQMHELETINTNLTSISFRAATVSLELLRGLDQAEEFTRKYVATDEDPGYGSRREEMLKDFSRKLQELRRLTLSRQESDEADKLETLWTKLLALNRTPQRQIGAYEGVRQQVERVIQSTQQTIDTQVKESSRGAQRAEEVSRTIAAVALLVSLVVSFWIVQSISRSLGRLTEGTRAVAKGKFSYRLDESGNDELTRLAEDFNTMILRLGQLDELKKDFVSHVSHELKVPLISVQETVSLLLEGNLGPLTEKQRRFLELNLQSCRRLSALINNLLDVSRLEAGVMEYEMKRQDFATLVREAVGQFEAQRRTIELHLPESGVFVECDHDRMIQVVTNLVGNGLKYSPPDTSLQVRLQANGAGSAVLAVADSGPGIPDGEKAKVFEKFHRAKQSRKAAEGAGLGLAITKAIVEAHKGRIWVEDNPKGGSVFQVELVLR